MNEIRCSSLDSLFACAPSVLDGGLIEVSVGGKTLAEAGSAIHACLAEYVESGGNDMDYKATFARHAVPEDDRYLEMLNYGVKAYGELAKYLPTPKVEVVVRTGAIDTPAGKIALVGTLDVASPKDDKVAVFVDWKSGWVDDGYFQQMFGYADALWWEMGRPDNVTIVGVIVFLSHHYYRVVKYNAAKLSAWEYDLVHNVLSKPKLFQPGQQCRYCTRFAECEGRAKYVSAAVDAFFDPNSSSEYAEWLTVTKGLLSGLTSDNKGAPEVGRVLNDLINRIKLVEHACDEAKDLVKETVARVGPVPTLNGFELALVDREVREIIAAKAIKLLRKHLSDFEITSAMKLSLPKLLASHGSKQVAGQRQAAKALLVKELEDAAAITVSVQKRLDERLIEQGSIDDANSHSNGTQQGAADSGGGQPASA